MSRLSTPQLQQDGLFIYYSGVFAVRLDEDGKFFLRANPDLIASMLCKDFGYFASDTALFWRAQLAHYGLPSISNSRDAKRLLQHAIHCGSLRVPEAILDIEDRLKQRSEAENFGIPREPGTDDKDTNDLVEAPSETVETPSETVETPSETVETPSETAEAPSETAKGISKTVEANLSQKIVESMERFLPRDNTTTKEEPVYSRDMQNTYRDPGATLWLATTDRPFPGITLPLTGDYICTTTEDFEVPNGTLKLSHDPKCGTWWAHFHITFLEGPSGRGNGHIRSYYGMCLIPRGSLDDGQFWQQPFLSGFKLRTVHTCKVIKRTGGLTFDWRRSALTD